MLFGVLFNFIVIVYVVYLVTVALLANGIITWSQLDPKNIKVGKALRPFYYWFKTK